MKPGEVFEAETLQRALIAAFPTAAALAQFVEFRLDENAEVIAAGPNLEARVFALIEWARKRGRVTEVVAMARLDRPDNPLLRTLDVNGARTDWHVDEPLVDVAQRSREVRSVPPGPLVPGSLVPVSLIWSFATQADAQHLAVNAIRRANLLRRAAEPERHPTVIDPGDLPALEATGARAFWADAFIEARKHGPRMLAALLLAQPDDWFDRDATRDRRELLAILTAGVSGHRQPVERSQS